MSAVLATGGLDSVGKGAVLWLLAMGDEARALLERPVRAAASRALSASLETPLDAGLPLAAAAGDYYGAGWLDATAGCEFIDDRIRLAE